MKPKVRNPMARAQKATGEIAAARLYEDIRNDVALANETTPEELAELNQAMDELERRFPDLEGMTSAESFAQQRGKGRGSNLPPGSVVKPKPSSGKKPDRAGARPQASAPPARSSGGGGRRPRSAPKRASTRGRRAGRRALEQTGIPGAARSTSAFLLQGLGIVVGLSVAYLLLRNAQRAGQGRSAVEQIAGGFSRGVRLLVDPKVDPLSPGRKIDVGKPGSLRTARPGDTIDLTDVPRLVPPSQLRPGGGGARLHGGRRRAPHAPAGRGQTRPT